MYRSCSAFAPITNPILAPWGINAFNGYLAGGVEEGRNHDATELIAATKEKEVNILIDVGTADQFYNAKQLLPENFVMAAKKAGFGEDQVRVNYREGYDHSYYFISTFMEVRFLSLLTSCPYFRMRLTMLSFHRITLNIMRSFCNNSFRFLPLQLCQYSDALSVIFDVAHPCMAISTCTAHLHNI